MHKGALIDYLRYGDPNYYQFGIDMSRHNMDVDINHYHPTNYRFVGGHCGHSEDHTTNNRFPYISHTWLEGYLLDYYLTGNRRSLEMASLTGRGLVHSTNNLGVQCESAKITTNSNSRSLGQTLINLSGLYESTYNPRYISTMDKTMEQCILGQDTDGAVPGAVNHNGAWGTGYAERDQSPQKAARVASGVKQYLRIRDNQGGFDYLKDMCDWVISRGSFGFKLGVLYHNDLGNRTLQFVNASSYMCDAFTYLAKATGDRRYLDAADNLLLNAYEYDWDWISGTDLNMGRSYLYHFGQAEDANFAPVNKATVYDSAKTIEYLKSLQNPDGGFGHWQGLVSDMESTCRAVEALDILGSEPVNEASLVSWIDSCRSDNSVGYAVEPAWNEDVIHTYYAVETLNRLNVSVPSSSELKAWIDSCQNNRPGERGGYGDSPRPEEYYGLDTIGYYHTWESIVLHTAFALDTLDLLSFSCADPTSCKNFLDPYIDDSGGANCGLWSESFSEPVDPLSTLLLLKAYDRLSETPDATWRSNTANYLKGLQNADGGFSWAFGEPSTIRHTWACIEALELLGQLPDDEESAKQWVRSCANADGGFGNQPEKSSELQATYFAVSILGSELPEYSDMSDLELLARDWLFGEKKSLISEPVGANLMIHYKLDEQTGEVAYDEQAYSDGVLTGFDSGSYWIEGFDGNALYFDGLNDFVDISDSDLSDFHNKTISLWFRAESLPGSAAYIFGTKSSYRVYITFDSTGQLNAVVETGSVGTADISVGQWYHLSIVIEDTSDGLCDAAFYVNGNLVGETFDRNRHSGLLVGANIGSYNNGTSSFGNMTVDDFRIYDYPLGSEEIAWLATSPADENKDGIVDIHDFALLTQKWVGSGI
jgi:prenyltransferase beta subunit